MDNKNKYTEINIIEKSNALIFARDMSLSKRELLIFDCYLSFINPRDIRSKTITLKKRLLESVLGTQIKTDVLKKNISNLMKTQISVESKDGEWFQTVLFQNSSCYIDKDGEWSVSLTCSDYAQRYIFDIKHIGYARFQLKDVICLQSEKSIRLFEYLLANRYEGRVWTTDLMHLREVLNCTDAYYDDFNKFKTKILEPCINNINQKGELYNVKYKKITNEKRMVIGIQFELTKINGNRITSDLTEEKKAIEMEKNNMLTDLLMEKKENPFLADEIL